MAVRRQIRHPVQTGLKVETKLAVVARQIHCAFMTFPLHFYDTSQAPAAPSVSWSLPVKA
jgi:hypothetical protein